MIINLLLLAAWVGDILKSVRFIEITNWYIHVCIPVCYAFNFMKSYNISSDINGKYTIVSASIKYDYNKLKIDWSIVHWFLISLYNYLNYASIDQLLSSGTYALK